MELKGSIVMHREVRGGGGGAWTWPGANMSRLLHRPWTF